MTATLSRRSALTAGVALAAGTAVNLGALAAAKAAPLAGSADPIYAAIINHRSTWEAFDAAHADPDDKSRKTAERRAELYEIECAALSALAACTPTTLLGAAELLNYTLEMLDKEGAEFLSGYLPTILTRAMIAVATLGDAAVPVVVGRSI